MTSSGSDLHLCEVALEGRHRFFEKLAERRRVDVAELMCQDGRHPPRPATIGDLHLVRLAEYVHAFD